jgi:hypothetical protein
MCLRECDGFGIVFLVLPTALDPKCRIVSLIRSRGHFLKGRYDVHDGRHTNPAAPPTVHG